MIECIQRVIANIVERVGTQGAAKESLGSVKSSFNFMQNWCLSALTDLAMADATAFLSARAR